MIVTNSIDLKNEKEEHKLKKKMCSGCKLYTNNSIYMELNYVFYVFSLQEIGLFVMIGDKYDEEYFYV